MCTGFNLVLAHNTGRGLFVPGRCGRLAALGVRGPRRRRHRRDDRASRAQQPPQAAELSLTLIAAGALGNMIDRTVYGYVVDFLDFYWQGWHWPAFNVADVAICGGAFFLIVDELRSGRR